MYISSICVIHTHTHTYRRLQTVSSNLEIYSNETFRGWRVAGISVLFWIKDRLENRPVKIRVTAYQPTSFMGTVTFNDLAFAIIAMLLTHRVRKIKTETIKIQFQ